MMQGIIKMYEDKNEKWINIKKFKLIENKMWAQIFHMIFLVGGLFLMGVIAKNCRPQWNSGVEIIVVCMLIFIGGLIIHELCHAACVKILSPTTKVEFVFKYKKSGIRVFAISFNAKVVRWKMQIIHIAPFVCLTVVPLILFVYFWNTKDSTDIRLWILGTLAIINFEGSLFDILETLNLFRYPTKTLVWGSKVCIDERSLS
ncbi:MAG: DUF3267 domain-containing protein [Lachnospiraceae bacterium]|nr:DUF3267 domain-containing protein [Lachnospiraceae bacterium]